MRTLNLLVTAQTAQDTREILERSRWPGAGPAVPSKDPVPAWLNREFQEKITISPPFTFTTLEDIPLGKGCSGLLRHFDCLSDESGKKETGSQLILEYLNLLKCYWLIKVLKNGKEFSSRPVGSLARRFISNVELAVYQRLQNRTDQALIPATDDELRGLGTDSPAFHIWEMPREELDRLPWEPEEGEEKILAVSLTKDEKLIFLRSIKDSTVMRIVPIIEAAGNIRISHNYSEIRLSTKSDKFIPRYTASKPGDKLLAEIHQHNFTSARYELFDMKAAWQIQRAITGYQVRGDEPGVTWSIQLPVFSSSSEPRRKEVKGRAHIWQWNPLPNESAVGSPAPSTSTASTPRASRVSHSRVSTASTPRASMVSPTRASTASTSRVSMASPARASIDSDISETRSMYSTVSQASTLVRESEDHRQILQPIPPAIVLFGSSGSTHSYVHLDSKYTDILVSVYTRSSNIPLSVSGDLDINPKSCACSKKNSECKYMVIERPNKGTFKVRSVSGDERSLQNWDLAVLRGPVHPSGYKSSGEYMDCDYLSIKFPTHKERIDFDKRLRTYMGLYRRLFAEANQLERNAIQEANRPTKRGSFSNDPYSGLGGVGSSSSQAPQIESISRVSTFNLNF